MTDYAINYYESDKKYLNRFSYWFGRVKNVEGLLLPESKVITVPLAVFAAFVEDSVGENMGAIKHFVQTGIIPAMEGQHRWFMKNGCFSNKFDFQHCITNEYKALDDFIAIQYGSACLETGGISEIVLRNIIPWDARSTATMYAGMPLRPEARVFYDFDERKLLYSVNYWDFETVRPHLSDKTDAIVFDAVGMELESGYRNSKERVEQAVSKAMCGVDLSGQWSVDVLIDGKERLWLIDMAIAQRSTYWRGGKNDFIDVDMYEK